MTFEETKKLFVMLGVYFPTAKAAKGNDLMVRTWHLALEPYRYEDVRENVVQYVRSNKFFPDIADLTHNLLGHYGKSAKESVDWLESFCAEQGIDGKRDEHE